MGRHKYNVQAGEVFLLVLYNDQIVGFFLIEQILVVANIFSISAQKYILIFKKKN